MNLLDFSETTKYCLFCCVWSFSSVLSGGNVVIIEMRVAGADHCKEFPKDIFFISLAGSLAQSGGFLYNAVVSHVVNAIFPWNEGTINVAYKIFLAIIFSSEINDKLFTKIE